MKKLLTLGLNDQMPLYLYTQGYVFNVLNATGLLLSVFRFLYIAFISPFNYPFLFVAGNLLPVLLCVLMMLLIYKKQYVATVYFSFFAVPLTLLFLGIYSHDRGLFLYLVPYTIYPFFFLNSKRKIIVTFTVISLLFIAGMAIEVYGYKPITSSSHDFGLELISFSGALILTFISLYSIKFQVWKYQEKIRLQKELLKNQKTEIEQQNQKLQELNHTKDKLFSIIGHDLKTPIQGIYLLLQAEDDDEEAINQLKAVLPELKAELKRTSELFENLLIWAKTQIRDARISTSSINISELASAVTYSLEAKASEKSIKFQNEISSTFINADKNILEIVLRNLLSNAIKFSEQDDTISIKGRKKEGYFEISIVDNGIGMNADVLQKIQNKTFFTSAGTKNEKGTGLGLIICKDLIEKCRGDFHIESEEGKGTSISILLPQ